MSCAILKPSRDRPSRKSPAIASRGAKPMLCTKPSNFGQVCRQVGEQLVDLRVVAHVAIEDQLGVEVRGEFGDAVLEALADVAEGQFGALRVAGLGDAVGDRAVRQHAGDQEFLAGEKAHESLPREKSVQNCRMRGLLLCAGLSMLAAPRSGPPMRYAQLGDLKYPPGFTHFDYVNPEAPKGGEIRLVPPTAARPTSTSSTRSRSRAPRRLRLGGLMFESLLTGSAGRDRPPAYGLLAEDVEVAPDRLSATFRLQPEGALPQRRAGAGRRREAFASTR